MEGYTKLRLISIQFRYLFQGLEHLSSRWQ